MKIRLNSDRINNIKSIAKKYVLITSISVIILSSSITKTEAQALDNNYSSDIGYYEISDDKDFLYMENSKNLSIISTLQDLTEISLYNCNIDNTLEETNISVLTIKDCIFYNSNVKLPSTITELEIDNTMINFNILKPLTNLKKISFKNIEFDSLTDLEELSTINELNFDSCNIGSLNGIENLITLKSLSFTDTGIETIEQLQKLYNLNSLTLSQTYVSDLSPIKDSNISVLDITDSTNIKNLNVITEMKNLSNLTATNCEMSYTPEVINHIKKQNIYSNITEEGLILQKQINSIVDEIIKPNMSENEKIEAIVEYVTTNLEYDYEIYKDPALLEEYNTNSLKYALKGIGGCKNYTALTTALLRATNINGYEQKNDDHIWNIVELDGIYYYIDSTFIDIENIKPISESANFMTNKNDFFLEHNSILMPSSMYNNTHNLNFMSSEQSTGEEIVNKKNMIFKNTALGGVVGIAIALNSAFIIKNGKKKRNSKLTVK